MILHPCYSIFVFYLSISLLVYMDSALRIWGSCGSSLVMKFTMKGKKSTWLARGETWCALMSRSFTQENISWPKGCMQSWQMTIIILCLEEKKILIKIKIISNIFNINYFRHGYSNSMVASTIQMYCNIFQNRGRKNISLSWGSEINPDSFITNVNQKLLHLKPMVSKHEFKYSIHFFTVGSGHDIVYNDTCLCGYPVCDTRTSKLANRRLVLALLISHDASFYCLLARTAHACRCLLTIIS